MPLILPPSIPQDKQAAIAVAEGRVIVIRYRELSPFVYISEQAVNWKALEGMARAVLIAAGGALPDQGHFACPEAIAALAVWTE